MMSAEAISQVECSIIHLMCKTPLSSMDFHNVGCQSKTQQGTLTSKSTKIAYSKYCKGSWFLPYSSRPKAREPGPSGLAYMAQPPPRFLGQTRQKVDIYRPGYHVRESPTQQHQLRFSVFTSLQSSTSGPQRGSRPMPMDQPPLQMSSEKSLIQPKPPPSLSVPSSKCMQREREREL